MNTISKDISANIQYLDQEIFVNDNFDIINREIRLGQKEGVLYFIDGFAKDDIIEKLMEKLLALKEEDLSCSADEFKKKLIPYGEVDLDKEFPSIITKLLSGVTCLFIDGFDQVFEIDCRTYPQRSVEEPDKDKVMRGSRDGFVETLVLNTAMMRRRIRNPQLIMQMMSVGNSSKTDIAVCYMKDRVDEKLLKKVLDKIQSIKIDALTMNQESLAECLYRGSWLNPFPKFRYTERPDAASASVLEGKIAVMVDNSPSVMILPTTLFGIMEEADDYYFPPITGTYLRLSRIIINIVALILTPTFLLLMQHPEWIPESLQFIKIKDTINIPILVQFLILEFSIDGLRLAALNTPSMLSTPFSVVAALILGDFTVSSGWFNSEVMLYMAFVAIANYSQVSFELGYALKFMRLVLLILTGLFHVWGFIGGIIVTILAIACNGTIAGRNYLYPLIPFNFKLLVRHLFRITLPASEKAENQKF
ncbi:spore germination protein [Anaerosporobacter faecicola]|uniref:spore germination protein n=1 Tax=Anaerosporobacter faecicola TaxID=2718714 RepID=UPI001EE5E926|nr:spore germination protein [Anaerosporobacter faecicola]